MQKVLIRVDSSLEIGTGHISRMLVLAHAFKVRGYAVEIATRELEGYLDTSAMGFVTHILKRPSAPYPQEPARADYDSWLGVPLEHEIAEMRDIVKYLKPEILVVDHYSLGRQWEVAMREHCKTLIAVDDIANRTHSCDVLIDHNHFTRNPSARYEGLVEDGTLMLLGTSFSLLNATFIANHPATEIGPEEDNCKVLIFFGGSYQGPLLLRTLESLSLSRYSRFLEVTVVSRGFQLPDDFDAHTMKSLTNLGPQESLDELIRETDFVIGAGGVNTWERLASNKFSLVVSIASNQEELTKELDALGYLKYLGRESEVTSRLLVSSIDELFENRQLLSRKLSNLARLVDGRGPSRVVAELEKFQEAGPA